MAFKMNGFSGFGDGTGSSFKKKTSSPKGAAGSEYRRKEYDARGWKYDDTIAGYNRDGTKKTAEAKNKKDRRFVINDKKNTTEKNTTTKEDTNKKDNNQSSIVDKAIAGHTVYEVGKYAKKFLEKRQARKDLIKGKKALKEGSKQMIKKGGKQQIVKQVVKKGLGQQLKKQLIKQGGRLISRVPAAIGIGGLGYLGYKVIEEEIKNPVEAQKRRDKIAKKKYTSTKGGRHGYGGIAGGNYMK